MNGNLLSDALGEIRDYYIQDAAEPGAKQRVAWRQWAAAAACLCLVLAGVLAARGWLGSRGPAPSNVEADAEAYCLYLDGEDACYLRFTYEDYIRFGLLPAGTPRASADELQTLCAVTKDDLGEALGVVSASGDRTLTGKTAYRYETADGQGDVCVVETGDKYEFYYRRTVSLQENAVAAYELLDRAFGHDALGYTLFPDDFSGAYIDGGSLVLLLTDVSDDATARYRAWAGAYAGTLVFRQADYSYNVLHEKTQAMAEELTAEGYRVSAYYVSETANRIVIELADSPSDRTAGLAKKLEEAYGVPVSIELEQYFVVTN